jgi:hypothetical protein
MPIRSARCVCADAGIEVRAQQSPTNAAAQPEFHAENLDTMSRGKTAIEYSGSTGKKKPREKACCERCAA